MHELAICQNLVDVILAELRKLPPPPRRLLSVKVNLGALQQLVPDSLQMAYELLTKDTPAAGSRLEVVEVPVTCACRACDWRGAVDRWQFRCGQCGSGDVELVAGREICLESLEIADEPEHPESLP